MPIHTHYADISETQVWRVCFTPPEDMKPHEVKEWLMEHWDNPDVMEKKLRFDSEAAIIFIEPELEP